MKSISTLFIALNLIAIFTFAHAQGPVNQSSTGQAAYSNYQVPDPRPVIRQSAQQIQGFLASENLTDPAQVDDFLENRVAPLFDFATMTSTALGPLNYHVNEQQREKVAAMIKKRFLTALASNLSNYRGGKVNYMNLSGNLRNGKVSMRLAVYLPEQYPTIIGLRIALGSDGWKIVDVSANGISAVAHYRNYIRSVAQRSGLQALFQ